MTKQRPFETASINTLGEAGPEGSKHLSAYEYLNNPKKLREYLEARGALTFIPYASGLFPAGDLSSEMREATGMGMAWLRDNAHVAIALLEAGRLGLAVPAGRAMLTVLNNNRELLDRVVNDSSVSAGHGERLPVRFQGDSLANDTENRIQNDSTGYALLCIARLINKEAITPTDQDFDTLAQTVRYLDKIRFWQVPDEGHWEEDIKIHASSIGVVIAGLIETEKAFKQLGYQADIDFKRLISRGEEALSSILAQGVTELNGQSKTADDSIQPEEKPFPDTINADEAVKRHFAGFGSRGREYDAALLFLAEPLGVFKGEQAAKIVEDIEQNLLRDTGIIRYPGDTYWEPRFTHIMSVEQRTTQAPGRADWRNQTAAGIAYTGTEAQWTLFDPILSTYWGNRYAENGDPKARQKQLFYLDRSLAQLVLQADGRLLLSEAYYYEAGDGMDRKLIPNDHTPLLWSQANLLTALRTFEATST